MKEDYHFKKVRNVTERIPEIYVKVSDLEFNINFVANSLNPDFLK